ncbi:MAG: acyl-CoA thioesterase, partial [Candidatus Pseudothioglobus sp.]
TVSIGARVDSIADQYFTMKYAVISDKNQKLVAVGGAKVVMFDYDKNMKASVPQEVKKRILNLEKTKVELV